MTYSLDNYRDLKRFVATAKSEFGDENWRCLTPKGKARLITMISKAEDAGESGAYDRVVAKLREEAEGLDKQRNSAALFIWYLHNEIEGWKR